MLSDFIFRRGTKEDVEQLTALGLASYGQYFGQLQPEAIEKLRAGVSNPDLYSNLLQTATCFVCQSDNTVVGMAFIVPNGNPWDIFPADWSYIRMVGVLPSYSGKGIARELTRLCIEHAKSTGEKTIALHTSEMMNAARHIYESFGFKVFKEIEPRFGKRYWLYTLDF